MLPCFGIFNAQTADAAKWAASAQQLSGTKKVNGMDEIIYVAALPFYAMACFGCWFGMNYGMHMLRRLDQSATETQMTETTSPAATQQK